MGAIPLDYAADQPRWRVVRKIARGLGKLTGAFIALVIVAWLIWYGIATRQLDNEIERIRAEGFPARMVDLVPTTMPKDADNRYVLMSQLDIGTDWSGDDELGDPLSVGERELLTKWIAANQAVLREIDLALSNPIAVQRVDPTADLIGQMLPELNTFRIAAILLKADAKMSLDAGDPRSAFASLDKIARVAETCGQGNSIDTHLLAAAFYGLQADAIEKLAWRLDIGDRPDQLDRAAVETMIRSLTDNTAIDASFRRALSGERVLQIETLEQMISGNAGLTKKNAVNKSNSTSLYKRVLATPFYRYNAVVCSREMRRSLQFLPASDSADFSRRAATQPSLVSSINYMTPTAWMLVFSIERAFENRFRIYTNRNLAATALAIRLYRLDHGDEFPPTLEALVPKYLPEVLVDHKVGKPLLYDAMRKIVWGVNMKNSIDHGGVGEREMDQTLPAATLIQITDRVAYLMPDSTLRHDRFVQQFKFSPIDAWTNALVGTFTIDHMASTTRRVSGEKVSGEKVTGEKNRGELLISELVVTDLGTDPTDANSRLLRASRDVFSNEPKNDAPMTLRISKDGDAAAVLSVVGRADIMPISIAISHPTQTSPGEAALGIGESLRTAANHTNEAMRFKLVLETGGFSVERIHEQDRVSHIDGEGRLFAGSMVQWKRRNEP